MISVLCSEDPKSIHTAAGQASLHAAYTLYLMS